MKGFSTAKAIAAVVAFVAALGLLRYKPWAHSAAPEGGGTGGAVRQRLTVGFLPVT